MKNCMTENQEMQGIPNRRELRRSQSLDDTPKGTPETPTRGAQLWEHLNKLTEEERKLEASWREILEKSDSS